MVSIVCSIWAERRTEMQSGEWTKGMSLALASAVEALALQDETTSPLSILKRLKRFEPKPKYSHKLSEKTHEDVWELTFRPAGFNCFDTIVTVLLLCENHSQYRHDWCHRSVSVAFPNETQQGEHVYTYTSRPNEPLKFECDDAVYS
jgi:hypothetical protein